MGLFRRKRPETGATATPEGAAANSPGPSWMSAEDWASRLDAYRRQGRSDDEIRDIAEHLATRGPRKPRTRDQGMARSQEIGIVTRAVYVPADEEGSTERRRLRVSADRVCRRP